MDMQTPADPTDTASRLPPAVLNCLLRMLAAALPSEGLTPEIIAENLEFARAMFFAFQPHDAAEAAAAIRAVAAHFASMDMHARAFKPGLSDDTVMRLRASTNTCTRVADAARRALRKPPAATPKPRRSEAAHEAAAPAPPPAVPCDPSALRFYPRDRYGNTIRLWQPEQLTQAQLHAALACPRDPELEAVAIAEEEAMIAEQAAQDAAGEAKGTADERQ